MTDADFPIVFADPADAQHTWERDDMHMPFAQTPLAEDFSVLVIGRSFNPHYEQFGSKFRLYGAAWNGWIYYSGRSNVPEDEEKAAEARWTEACRARIPVTAAYWNDEVLPELKGIFGRIADLPIEDLSPDAAADAWLDAWSSTLRAWVLHFFTIMGPYQVLDDLIDAYNAAMGPDRDAEALGLLGGGHHELEDVEEAIETLALLATAEPELARAIEAAAAGDGDASKDPPAPDLEALRALPGGAAFVGALDRFLATHGHLGQNHDDLRLASWGEEPRQLLGLIALRLRKPAQPAREREAALRRHADELAAAVRAKLADRPDQLAAFETVLGHAREIAYLTEGHNYWIDRLSQARLRALSMRVGRRLVRDNVVDAADDVFFLHYPEVADALRDGLPRHALIRERRAEHERNERRTPPYYVGKIPDKPTGDRFDGPRVPSTEADMLRGTGASAGIVRALARVTLSQDDFGRIQPGDVIVCPSSNPSWVPVFTIAGGLVTNTGGVLSHAAVVAREFGLPAVVGVADATTRIADGRLVEIDGTAGTVRLL